MILERRFFSRLIFAMICLLMGSAGYADKNEAGKETAKNEKKNTSNTQHSFEDLLVQGKYQFSDEAVTTVEEDKVLDSLIGVRQDFKDRLKKTASY